jgi:hypothetical protein
VPDRVAFGLPQHYGRRHNETVTSSTDRRASPLFIHLDQAADNDQATALLAFLPAQFLPDGQLNAFGQPVTRPTDDSLWYPIHGFLDRLISSNEQNNPPTDRAGYKHFSNTNWWQKRNQDLTATEVQLNG